MIVDLNRIGTADMPFYIFQRHAVFGGQIALCQNRQRGLERLQSDSSSGQIRRRFYTGMGVDEYLSLTEQTTWKNRDCG